MIDQELALRQRSATVAGRGREYWAGLAALLLTLLALVLLVLYSGGAPSEPPSNVIAADLNRPSRPVFAVYEDRAVKVYATSLDGGERVLLLSQPLTESNIRTRPHSILDVQLSPDGEWLAYRFARPGHTVGAPASIHVIDRLGRPQQTFEVDAVQMSWTPDSQSLLYAVAVGTPFPESHERIGPREWYRVDRATAHAELVAPAALNLDLFVGWVDVTHALFGREFYGEPLVLDLDTHTAVPARLGDPIPAGWYGSNPSGTRAVTADWVAWPDPTCTFREADTGRFWVPGAALFEVDYYDCITPQVWRNDDEFYHTLSLRVDPPYETGFVVLASVYRYDMRTRRDVPVVEATLDDGRPRVYRLAGAYGDQAVVVVSTVVQPRRQDTLEIRDPHGRNPVILATSDEEILFLGWLR